MSLEIQGIISYVGTYVQMFNRIALIPGNFGSDSVELHLHTESSDSYHGHSSL